jgi:hypothetical protein
MNYWIERTPSELRETLQHVDILMINDSETRQLSNEHNLLRAAKHIFKMGPSTLVVKRGEYGAMMVDKRGVFCVPAFPLEEPHDPTGAGDSCGRFHGVFGRSERFERRDASPSHDLRVGDGEFHRGAIRFGPAESAEAERDTRQGTALREIDAIQIVVCRILR